MESQMYRTALNNIASHAMGICRTIKEKLGTAVLKDIIDEAAKNSGKAKADKLSLSKNPAYDLAMLLEGMLKEFGTKDIAINQEPSSLTVNNPACGCLPPFVTQAEEYGFGKKEARNYACRRCMPSYQEASKLLEVKFKGRLTKEGCFMQFYKNEKL
jgi:hypothetical protein